MKKLLLIVLISVSTFAQTDLRHKISQMLMIGFQGKSVTDTMLINDLNKRGVGGVILFAANIESPTQLNQLTTQLKSYSSIPLFISVDQEGGKVARLNATNGYQSTYSAFKIGTYFNNEFDTRGWAGQMATWLSSAGINIDLAPVADVDVNPTSPAIGALDRSFSKIPDSVYQHCFWFIDEFHQRNLFNTLKHFPGHGSAATDSHLGFTDITNTWADSELIPFRKLIASGYNDFIMSGHLFNSNLDPNYPASLSNKVLTELLRDSLKFKGLIITDGMFMGAISNNYTFDKAVELAINAGNDVLLYTANNLNGKSLVDSVVNIVMNKISEGKITEQRIDESYKRIIMKKSLLTEIKNIAGNIIPDDFEISNYPNPFNSSTQINLRISRDGFVSMKLYNIIGEEIKEIVHEYMEEGVHKFLFNGNELSSGVYLLRMNIGENFLSHKIILMK